MDQNFAVLVARNLGSPLDCLLLGRKVRSVLAVARADLALDGDEALVWYQSSPDSRRAFCGTCGAPVAYAADRYPDEIHFYAALLDDAADFAPQGHVHWDERLPWVHLADDLPKKEG